MSAVEGSRPGSQGAHWRFAMTSRRDRFTARRIHKHPLLRAIVAITLALLWIIAVNHVGAQTSAGGTRTVSQAWTLAAPRHAACQMTVADRPDVRCSNE